MITEMTTQMTIANWVQKKVLGMRRY